MENYASKMRLEKIRRDLPSIFDATASSSENYIFQKSLISFLHDAAARRKFAHLFVSPPLHFAEVYVLERVEFTLFSSVFFFFLFYSTSIPREFRRKVRNARYFFVIEVMSRYKKNIIILYIYMK